jgi:hypothetical protein
MASMMNRAASRRKPKKILYTWDEMAALFFVLLELTRNMALVSPGSKLPDLLADWVARVPDLLHPTRAAGFKTGLLKLRREPTDKLAALITGESDWWGDIEDDPAKVEFFEILWRPSLCAPDDGTF